MNGVTSKPDFFNEVECVRVEGRSSSIGGSFPDITKRDTRASSSCVSCIYSAGGRGINGGGACGVEGVEADEDGEPTPPPFV